MKKLLFTFATLFVALTAAATVVPTLAFVQDGNAVEEISVAPGGNVDVSINLAADGYDAMQGVQLQWIVYTPNHEPTSVVTFKNFGTNARPKYFTPGNIHADFEWSTSASYLNDGSVLRLLSKNDDGYPLLEGGEYDEYGADASIWNIGFVAAEDWTDEYVTVELDATGFQNVWSLPAGGSVDHEQVMVLKIYNANYVPPVQNKDFDGTVTVTVDEEGNVTATYTPGENGAPDDIEIVCNPSKLDAYGEDIPVAVTVTGTGFNEKTFNETVDWVKPAPKELQGTIAISDHVDGHFTVTYNGEEAVEITCTITKQGAKETVEGYDLPGYGTYDVYAKATATDPAYEGDYVETTKVLVWEAPEDPEFAGTVQVTVDDDGNVTAIYVAAENEEVPEDIEVVVNPSHLDNYGENIPVTVTVTGTGFKETTFNETVDYLEPVTPPAGKTNSPSVNKYNKIVYDGPGQCHNEYHFTYTNAESDPDATIYYAVGVGTYDEATDTWTYEYQRDDDGNIVYLEYVDELIFTTVGTYQITAYAQTEGKEKSDPVVDGFTVASTTSIEELFADKTLAGVRYFNLAGQEMQEANGICISVYTFTDGTQVAVKVMQ